MSKLKEPSYEDLRKELSDAEIAESFVFRSTLNAEEKNKLTKNFASFALSD